VRPPPRDVCESRRYVDRCPLRDCEEHIPGKPGVPLKQLALCGRVLLDVAQLSGGMTPQAVAHFLGLDVSRVYQLEKSGLAKLRLRLVA
jgi:hypothetical protein